MSARPLTTPSYIVLGLIEGLGEATPYDLKRIVNASLINFWSVQHSQLYTEAERLAKDGYLTERREEDGRKRKLYKITEAGKEAAKRWRAEPVEHLAELREPAILKLFFGADPAALAETQIALHRQKLAEFEQIQHGVSSLGIAGPRLALEMGMRYERTTIKFWQDIAAGRAIDGGDE